MAMGQMEGKEQAVGVTTDRDQRGGASFTSMHHYHRWKWGQD
jgi:hypothetical protein